MTGLRPLVAVFFDSGAVHRKRELLNQHIGEIRYGRNQRKLQGFCVQRLNTQCLRLGFAV